MEYYKKIIDGSCIIRNMKNKKLVHYGPYVKLLYMMEILEKLDMAHISISSPSPTLHTTDNYAISKLGGFCASQKW